MHDGTDKAMCFFTRAATFLLVMGLAGSSATALAADRDAGLLAATCNSCHGVRGASLGPAIPALGGLSRNYLIGAMLAYKHADDLAQAERIVDNNDNLEDVAVFKRPPTIMTHIAKGYSSDEIVALATYFEAQEIHRPSQATDAALADAGRRVHTKYCEKCHEDNGRSAADDVGLLAGQWQQYLHFTLQDFVSKEREMPKKMAEKMTAMQESLGEPALQQLVHFYASQQ